MCVRQCVFRKFMENVNYVCFEKLYTDYQKFPHQNKLINEQQDLFFFTNFLKFPCICNTHMQMSIHVSSGSWEKSRHTFA